mmetsp:Transcript_16199/g.30605  ORF Transcript_16199/g.30605 Transcript_16199/m.30605 type:complete len:528 (-) Transcript_16199:165-1748(-)
MEVDGANAGGILCCNCGVKIEPNQLNMCLPCLKNKVDITLGIGKQVTIFFCRGCGRYQRPPWITAELESRELLAMCLKKIRGLNKVKLVDASWIWTEPHSRRLKIKLTVQKEVFNNAIIQQTFVVEFIVANQQCPDCQKSYTEHTWESVVQVRQKVKHKRTFYWLEQLMIKHNVCEKCINIKEQPDGLDFYYPTKSLGQHMVNFLESVIPQRMKFSKKLITQDDRSNTYRYKYTWCVEIAHVCKDDVVVLNKRMCASMGGITPLLLCYKVSSVVMLIDPITMQRVAVSAKAFWRDPPAVACTRSQLREFVVVDMEEPNDPKDKVTAGKFLQGEATVMRDDDGAANAEEDRHLISMTHLAHQLKPGDTCAGYDLKSSNMGDDVLSRIKNRDLPEVILVRKTYPRRKNRHRSRKFRLKALPKETGEGANRRKDAGNDDMELFMNDLEEDPEMRADINLYKRKNVQDRKRQPVDDEDEDEDDGFPDVALDELIDDMESNLTLDSKHNGSSSKMAMGPPAARGVDDVKLNF